ncbi:MAG: YabP/YqfC family sporulation protein, partial [Oscillospiraceae bacterium]
ELLVENCRGVSGYDENFITLQVYGMNVTVAGAPLMLESFGAQGVRITGRIHSLTLEETAT